MSSVAKVVLVTGGSSGIGKAICTRLAAQGHTVFGTTRKVIDQPEGYRLIAMEVTDEASVQQAVAEVLAFTQRIDVVVNNAGRGIQGPAEDLTPEDAEEAFNTNMLGPHRVCRAVLPTMRAQGSGLIINISSLAANFGLPYRGFYCASKAALERYSETLSMETAAFGVHVVSLQPGEFKTNVGAGRVKPAIISAPYRKGYDRAMELLANSLAKSNDPDEVALLVQKIMATHKPRSRYRAAHGTQVLALVLHRILPGRIFQRMLMKHFE